MKVWVLLEDLLERHLVRGVYTTLDKAREAVAMSGRHDQYFYYVLVTVDSTNLCGNEDIVC